MTKKRVYDLAKEYGMKGQDLAAKLREFGFSKVKSHMTALTEFEELEIRGRLEAYGFSPNSEEEKSSGTPSLGGLKIKRKKKKKAPTDEGGVATSDEDEDEEPSEEPSATPVELEAEDPAPAAASSEVPAETPAAPGPEPEAPEEAPAETPGEVAAQATAEAEPAEPRPLERAASEPTPPPAEPPAPTVQEPEPPAEAPVAKAPVEPPAEAVPASDEASAEVEPAAAKAKPADEVTPAPKAGKQPAAEEEDDDKIVRPSDKRRTGKVVGFIDPSKFAQPERRRPDSRRLRSRDDIVPQVMPTMGRDRRSGQVRGDQTRGSLTAQQLREREQGRFLRRRSQQRDTRGTGRRGGGGRGDASMGSPFEGSSVRIEEPITIKKLANTLAVKENQVFRIAMRELGFGITINSGIDSDTAQLLAQEFGVELEIVEDVAAEAALLKDLSEQRDAVEQEHLVTRAPTVAFLGHVDHGKTTLIDTIRKSRIASGESGGITQHIGAYQVRTRSGHTVTVVDTPGHAAFTHMRARGANAVDIVVLVVAADDGVKPQTEEAYNHAKAAGTPVVVALNKIDKPEANPERVRNELSALGLTPEEWGGDTAMLPVSGLNGDGVDELLERVFLESEVLELHSHPEGPASGVVLEAEIQQGKGKVAHLLVQDGSLKKGDVILAGEGYGKVRSIHDDHGRQIDEAGPSMPVEVTGLNELPSVGDTFHVVDSLDKAKEVAEERSRKNRQMAQIEASMGRGVNRENLFEAVAQSEKPTINLIIKTDVQGSAEVLKYQLAELSNDEVDVKIVHSGVGQVLESDVDLAITSGAHILAFHTSAATKVRQKAERESIQVKTYEVIYELLDDVKRYMEGELAPELHEEITGHAEIRRVFRSSKFGNIAGCYILDGTVNRNNRARLLRDGNVVHTGSLSGLRRENDNVKEVREGFECGILLQNYNDIKEGDVIETYKVVEVKRTL